jgi:hypothetical protein
LLWLRSLQKVEEIKERVLFLMKFYEGSKKFQ